MSPITGTACKEERGRISWEGRRAPRPLARSVYEAARTIGIQVTFLHGEKGDGDKEREIERERGRERQGRPACAAVGFIFELVQD